MYQDMPCQRTDEHAGAGFVCHGSMQPGRVFINALAEAPECTRREDASRLADLSGAEPRPVCYVYCAQRTCDAAQKFMASNADELASKCAAVAYLPGGALEMDPASLIDGQRCHAKIAEHNLKSGLQPGCLTCDAETLAKVGMKIDEETVMATYMPTSDAAPDWYRRAGIVGSLPTQFSCDSRYKGERPTPHANGDSTVSLDISSTDLPKDALLAYWAAKPSTDIVSAERAYGEFTNSGIVQCADSVCDFAISRPARYTADGKVFKRHIHVTEWLGDRWNLKAKTIDIE